MLNEKGKLISLSFWSFPFRVFKFIVHSMLSMLNNHGKAVESRAKGSSSFSYLQWLLLQCELRGEAASPEQVTCQSKST